MTSRKFTELRFHATYYFANVVRNVLDDQFEFIRLLDEFYGDDQYLAYIQPFQRTSVLHWFIRFLVDTVVWEEMADVDINETKKILQRYAGIPSAIVDMRLNELPIEDKLRGNGIEYDSFLVFLSRRSKTMHEATHDDVDEYHEELRLSDAYETMLSRTANEVFFLLFQNRQLMLTFNNMMANKVADATVESLPAQEARLFAKDGVLKRVAVPKWVERAVYFRDRGRCVYCHSDISGLLSLAGAKHFDHMVPLVSGGLNDVTNIQLLCAACNLKKGGGTPRTSSKYEMWYEPEDE